MADLSLCVVFNPAAKGGQAKRFRHSLERVATLCALKPTSAPGDARRLAAEAVREGFDTLVAAGGDGTLNEVINGIGDVPDGFNRVRLGLLPLGTVNVFARELRLPGDLDRAWQVILARAETRIDLARVEWPDTREHPPRFFVQLAGAGLDARAIELVSWKLKQKLGWIAYVLAGAKAIGERQPEIQVAADGQALRGELVLVGNGRYYGGNHALFPAATLTDGWLDVLVMRKANWAHALRCLWGLCTGRLLKQRGLRHLQIRELHLSSSRKTSCQVDGEWAGPLPVSITLLPLALRIIVPGVVLREHGASRAGLGQIESR